MSQIPITLQIADRPYRLVIEAEEEALFREAAVKINERIKAYSHNYAFKDRQDLLAMVALQSSYNALKNEKIVAFRDHEMIDKLQEIDTLLSNV